MKKIFAILLCLFIFSSFGCGIKTGGIPENSISNSTIPDISSDESALTTTPSVKPMTAGSIPLSKNSIYGEDTGTEQTYTGLSPLSIREFNVGDPENTKGLNNTAKDHSFGVSKNEVPNSISIENQKYYSQYGALTLNTSGEKVIYLTFDCGYENGYTKMILDTLLEKQVPAAFFVTLPYLKSSPELAARMIKEGHIVGNHSNRHPNFTTISRVRMAEEIQAVDDYLRQHFGYSAPYFRFPEGVCSDNCLELVSSLGYTSVFWSAAYADWDTNKQKGADYAFDTVTARLHPGCVLLLHVVSSDNAAALSKIIDYAKNRGDTFVQLDY